MISLFAQPRLIDELPWLTPSRAKLRRRRLVLHGRITGALILAAAPFLTALDFGGDSPAPKARALRQQVPAGLIESPFAPKALRPLSEQQALAWNASVPQTALAIPAASPFAASLSAQGLSAEGPAVSGTGYARSLQCLTAAIYYEAGNEPADGQRAVAQVVLNRVRHPAYPHSVCGVVFQGSERRTGCQFSFTCDGSLARQPSQAGWARATGVAAAALGGSVYAPIGWATHYHADYVVPYWARTLEKLATVGRHIFYRWGGGTGAAQAFTGRYAGNEPALPGMLGAVATAPAPVPAEGATLSQDRPVIAYSAGPATSDASALIEARPSAANANAPAADATPPAPIANRWIIGTPAR